MINSLNPVMICSKQNMFKHYQYSYGRTGDSGGQLCWSHLQLRAQLSDDAVPEVEVLQGGRPRHSLDAPDAGSDALLSLDLCSQRSLKLGFRV